MPEVVGFRFASPDLSFGDNFVGFCYGVCMKRSELLKHLKKHGALFLREGSRHSIFFLAQRKTQIPRHTEIVDELARKICKDLEIPFVR